MPASGLSAWMAGLCLASALCGQAIAGPTNGDLLTGFDAIVNGNFSTSSESEGPIWVGGNLAGAGNVQNKGLPLPSSLSGFGSVNVVGNTNGVNMTTNQVDVKVATPNQGATFNGAASVTYNYSFPTSFASAWSQLVQLSSYLGTLATTAGSSLSGSTLTASNTPVSVLNITTAQLASLSGGVTTNLGSTGLFIINVTGSSYNTGNGVNFNLQDISKSGLILWNFTNATTLTFGQEFGGTILAPNAAVTNGNSIDGTLVAKSFTGSGELHDRPLTNVAFLNTVAVAEPSMPAVLAVALAGLLVARRRRT